MMDAGMMISPDAFLVMIGTLCALGVFVVAAQLTREKGKTDE
jgi:hypothetical protein